MAFSIVHGDIVTMDTDAIVNAANSQYGVYPVELATPAKQ